MEWVGFAIGLFVVVGTWSSILRTLVVPRGLASKLTATVDRIVQRGFLTMANRFDDYDRKDAILVAQGPFSLLILLVTWLALLLIGFALVATPFIVGNLGDAVIEAGSSMFTLGFAAANGTGPAIIHFLAAATGLIVVALQIAYLPTLYAAFNRRETLVTMLQSRAGSPAWGAEILARHHIVGILDNMPAFYAEWEQWAADVAESHTNYPILIRFRSPHPLRSWIVGLLAVMDSAALYMALCPDRSPSEARLCTRMGFLSLRDIASVVHLEFDPDPFPDDPIELTFDEFLGGVKRLEEVGFPMERSPEEAWAHFKGWRVNYEKVAYALADRAVAPPGPWSGPRHHLPGLQIIPRRPANRGPGDHRADRHPRGEGQGW